MSDAAYTWDYRFDVQPYDKLIKVLEAFFASYPGGDYTLEHKETYKLMFRRGSWKRAWFGLGDWVPDDLPKGNFPRWPVRVRLLVRPSPENYAVAICYELYLPRQIKSLSAEIQSSVDQHARNELNDLAHYLAECTSQPAPKLES